MSINHPFIIKFFHSFQSDTKLFFALEYCPGGELFNLMQRQKRFSDDEARFYAAQIILAIKALHDKGIIYRDLKPENVLVDASGYIRITDFGLSRMNVIDPYDAAKCCGTPEYLAPEIVMGHRYGKVVDWWTLGTIIYEMLVGVPPFYTQNTQKLFQRIKDAEVKYPSDVSELAQNLINKLMQKDPSKRLGYTQGADEIASDPWFTGINWKHLYDKEYVSPHVPKLENEYDLSNFYNSAKTHSKVGKEQLVQELGQNSLIPDFLWNTLDDSYNLNLINVNRSKDGERYSMDRK